MWLLTFTNQQVEIAFEETKQILVKIDQFRVLKFSLKQ